MAENDFSINDEPTMRPKEERGGRGAFALGNVIAGRYVVEKVLGEGGMGIVYQCLDKVGGVSVAVKCLPPEVSRNADEMEDIRANYRLVSDLHHPNIACARTLEVDGSTGDYYLVMDLARGTSLKRWMRRNSQATMEAKLAILRQVAAALDYAHARKVIHRDVKPENVMVDDEGGVKVLDFGLAAQIRSSQSRTSNTVTSKGGTPGYKSPEQWLGRPQREPADVYSFGVMAYWLFSGHLPFDGDDPVVLGHAVLSAPVGPIHDLPAHMNAALVKALAKAPEDRFSSCTAFVDALEGKVGSRVPRDRMGGPRSRAAVKGIIAAALLAALAGGGYYGWTKYDEGVKAREAQHAEERARLEKANEERIAKLKAEAAKKEAEAQKKAGNAGTMPQPPAVDTAAVKPSSPELAALNVPTPDAAKSPAAEKKPTPAPAADKPSAPELCMAPSPREEMDAAIGRGEYAAAAQYAKAILSITPDDPYANFAVGMSHFEKHAWEPAERHLRKCVKQKPDEAVFLNNLAVVLLYRGRYDDALEHARRALKILPGSKDVQDTIRQIEKARNAYGAKD